MIRTLKHVSFLFALAVPAFFSASSASAADAQFMHPDAEVRKGYPIQIGRAHV